MKILKLSDTLLERSKKKGKIRKTETKVFRLVKIIPRHAHYIRVCWSICDLLLSKINELLKFIFQVFILLCIFNNVK